MHCLIHYYTVYSVIHVKRSCLSSRRKNVNINIVFLLFSHEGSNGEFSTTKQLMSFVQFFKLMSINYIEACVMYQCLSSQPSGKQLWSQKTIKRTFQGCDNQPAKASNLGLILHKLYCPHSLRFCYDLLRHYFPYVTNGLSQYTFFPTSATRHITLHLTCNSKNLVYVIQ